MKILFTFIFVVLYFNFILASLTDHKVNLEEKNSAHPDNFYQPPKCSHFPKYNYEHSTPHPLVVMSPDFVSYDQKSQRNPPFVEPPYYPTSQQAPYRSLASNTRLYQPGAYKEIPQIPIPYDQKSQMPSSYDQMLHPSTLYHKLPQAPSTYEKRLRLPMFYDQRSQMTSSYDRMPHHFTSYKQITSFPPSYNQPPHLSISIQRLPSIPSSSDNYQPHSSSSREPKPYAPSYSNQNLFSSQNDRIYFLNQNFPSLFRLPSSRHLVNYYKKNHQQLPYLGSSYYGYPTYSPATQKRYPPWFIQNIPVSRPMEKTKEPIFLGKGVYNILTEGSAELICSFENSSHQVVSVC